MLNEGWFTGFCEGDGSVGMQESPNRLAKIQLGQKDGSPLRYIHSCTSRGVFGHAAAEDYDYLIFNGRNCIPLLKVLSRHVVSAQFVKRLNIVLSEFGMPLAATHEPTLDWVVGFWDAEGGSSLGAYLGSEFYVRLYQKERGALDSVRRLVQFGSVQPYVNRNGEPMHCWAGSGENALKLAYILLERSQCDKKRKVLSVHIDECLTRRRVREWIKENPERTREVAAKGGVLS